MVKALSAGPAPRNLTKLSGAILALLASLLAACGGGGGGDSSFCVGSFQGGSTDWSCTNCSGVDPLDDEDDFDPAIDNHSGTSQAFGLDGGGQIVIRAEAPAGMTFPSGVDAGALMRFPAGTYAEIGVRFNLYRNGVLVDEGVGGAVAAGGNVPGAGGKHYYTVEPTLEFDRIDAVVHVTGNIENAAFVMYEFCGDR